MGRTDVGLLAKRELCDSGSVNRMTNASFQVDFQLELLIAVKQCIKYIKMVKIRKKKRLACGRHES